MKKGSSMIELVIAIVIMGFAVSVLPTILTTVSQNNANTKVIEDEIAQGATRIQTISTGFWDENTAQTKDILRVSAGDDELNASRAGLIEENGRRKFSTLNASILGLDSGENKNLINDIDDLNGTSISYTTNDGNFPLEINSTITVDYLNDSNNYTNLNTFDFNSSNTNSQSTNLKMITTITHILNISKDINRTVTFRAFRANIGASTWQTRIF